MSFSSHSPQNQGNPFPSLKPCRFDHTIPKDSPCFSVTCEFELFSTGGWSSFSTSQPILWYRYLSSPMICLFMNGLFSAPRILFAAWSEQRLTEQSNSDRQHGSCLRNCEKWQHDGPRAVSGLVNGGDTVPFRLTLRATALFQHVCLSPSLLGSALLSRAWIIIFLFLPLKKKSKVCKSLAQRKIWCFHLPESKGSSAENC